MNIIAKLLIAVIAATTLASSAFASPDENVAKLQHEWAQIKYQTPKDQQEKQFEQLVKEADQTVTQNPNRADVLIWHAIIEASYAGAKGSQTIYAVGQRKSLRQARSACLATYGTRHAPAR